MKRLNQGSKSKLVLALLLSLLPFANLYSQVINPTQASVLENGFGSIPYLTQPEAVFVSGNYAYVAGGIGLEIVDITLPGQPIHKGLLTNGTGGARLVNPTSVYISGSYAYVVCAGTNRPGSRGLEIVDVSDPSAPIHKTYLDLMSPLSVFVSGNYAYVVGSVLTIVDISNPGTPVIKALFDIGQSVHRSIYVSGNYAYVTNEQFSIGADVYGTNSLQIIDVANPAAPVLRGSIADGTDDDDLLVTTPNLISPYSVYVSGDYAYVASNGSDALEIVNVSNPDAPYHAGSLTHGTDGALLDAPHSVYVSGNYAYVASSVSDALEIVDVTTPSSPSHKGSLTNGSGGALIDNPHSVYVSGDYAYLASNSSNALEVVNVSNTAAPVHKGSLARGSGGAIIEGPRSVYVSGNYAYVASAVGNALEIVDVTIPSAASHKASITHGTGGALLAAPRSVFVSGNYAYVASSGSDALEIIDITNPAAPVHKGSLTNGTGGALLSSPYSVYVSGNYAYVASNGSNALEIVNVTNPASPVHTSSVTDGTDGALLGGPSSVYVSGIYAYVTSRESNAIEIINVSDPTTPFHVGSLAHEANGPTVLTHPESIFVSGDYAYVVGGFGALEIIDVSSPSLPVHHSKLEDGTGGAMLYVENQSVYVSGNYAYVAGSLSSVLEIVDISDPAAPHHEASITDGAGGAILGAPTSVFVSGSYAYVTTYFPYSLDIVYLTGPGITSVSPASGPIGTSVTVVGKNFDTFLSASINGMPATITAVAETSLTIDVPVGGSIGKISLNREGLKIESPNNFIVIPSALSASSIQQTSFTANWSDVGASAFMNGNYFLDVSTDNFSTYVAGCDNLSVGNAATFNVTELLPGTSYQWRVRSTDGITVSGNSDAASVLTIPETPTANAATAISQTGFTANWALVGNATGYYLDVASDVGFTTMIPGYINLGLSSTSTAQIISGLNSGTYYYRVRSSNASGSSPSSDGMTATTFPSNPTTTAATSITATGFTANWSAVTATSYSVDISTDNFATFVSGFDNQDVELVTSLVVSGLSEGTSYQYRVRANNATGSSGNSNVTALLTLPAMPPALAAADILPNQFNASWAKVKGATGYLLDVADNIEFDPIISQAIPTGDVSTHIVHSLTASTAYYYRVRADNPTGSSDYSNVISVTTLASSAGTQSSSLTVTSVGSTTVTLNFTNGNGSSHLVVASASSPLTGTPANQEDYTASLAFGSGSVIGNGFVISTGSSPIVITNLAPETNYYFQIFEYNGTGVTTNYNTTSSPLVSQKTLASLPAGQPVGITFPDVKQNSIAVSFAAATGSPSGYLVLRAVDPAPIPDPVNGTTYSIGSALGAATVANVGSSLSFFDAGLSPNTEYHYKVFSFNGAGITTNYRTTAPLEEWILTKPVSPVTNAVSLGDITSTGFRASWAPGTTNYLDVSSDNFVTFIAGYHNLDVAAEAFKNVEGLSSGTTYQYRVQAYNPSWTADNYSNSTTVLTLPAPPAITDATGVTSTSFVANWNKVVGANAYFLDVADNVDFNDPEKQNTPAGNVASLSVTGLTPETTYYYRVRANNVSGVSSDSDNALVTTMATAASTQSYALTFSDIASNSIQLSFTPGNAGAFHLVVASAGSPLTSALPMNQTTYTANSAFALGDPIGNGFIVSAGSNTSVTVTNLSEATAYYFQVFEFSGSNGTENYLTSTAPGNPASQSTLAAISASQPTELTFANITSSAVTISFTAATGSPTGYLVLRSGEAPASAPPSHGNTYSAGLPLGTATVAYVGPATSFNEAALAAGTTYYYSVYSYNGSGSAINYLITNPLQGSTIMLSPNPATGTTNNIGPFGFTANWTATLGASDYFLDVSLDNFGTLVPGYDNLPLGSVVSYDVTGLSPGTVYQYRIRAHNVSGSSGNSAASAVLTLPDAPPGSTAFNTTQNAFTASWTKVNGANAYYIDVAADSLFSSITYGNISLGNVSTYTVNGLSSASVYYFRLRAGNNTGVSINSNFVSVTTLATTVITQSSALSFTGISGTTITVNFTPGSGTSHLVVVSEASSLTDVPTDRTSYTANPAYGQGSKIGNGYVVNSGLSPVTVTGLSPAAIYYFQVFDFNGTDGTENYNITAAANNPSSQTTLSTAPLTQPTNLVFSNQTGTSVNLSFTAATGSPGGYLVLRAGGSVPTSAPVHGSTYTVGMIIGNATVAYAGSSITFFEAGLPTSARYYYAVHSYNGSGAAIRYLTSAPLEGNVTLDVAPPAITPAITNSSTITSSSTPTLSAQIIDNVGVASAQLFYKGISQLDFKTAQLNSVGGDSYSVTVQPDWYDEMGLEYYFIATDGNGNMTTRTTSSFAQIKNPILSIPTLPTGTEQTSYRIRAFPYVLPTDNKVETIYGNDFKDNTKASLLWWDPTLNGGSGAYLRYGTESGIQTIDPGKGYWVLSTSDIKPQLNDVPAPKYNSSNLFSMTLKPKWNEIGNPYPVPISWDDVIAYNAEVNPGAVFSKLNVYDGTGYKVATDGTMLNRYEGGFVKNMTSSDITIQIPFPAQANGGRTAVIGTDISRDSWNILLHIKQGDYVNELGGFGMHPLSITGQDRHDNFNPPRFMDLPEVNFVNPEVPSLVFSNDMVATTAEYIWEFTPAGNPGELAQLTWSDLSISGSQQLFLLDEEQLRVIDMNSTTEYDFVLTSSSRFRVFFGREVEKKITSQSITASTPFPNPVAADLRATVTIGLPDNAYPYQVGLQVFNMQGVQVESTSGLFQPGIHSVELKLSDAAAAGMHLYRLSVSSDKSSKVFTGKIMKP